jgi:hypothetical protein
VQQRRHGNYESTSVIEALTELLRRKCGPVREPFPERWNKLLARLDEPSTTAPNNEALRAFPWHTKAG